MKELPLSQGRVALVDDGDYATLSKFKWSLGRGGHRFYARRQITNPSGKKTSLLMHRAILPGFPEIDHIDGNGLNNQRHNLRGASRAQNAQAFQTKRVGRSSQFRGVTRVKTCNRWQASIQTQKRSFHLGLFENEIEAAQAYDTAAKRLFADRANLNFPTP